MAKTIYQELIGAGVEVDNHESDLYARRTKRALTVMNKFPSVRYTTFKSEVDGKYWIDIPFAFDPFWEARASKEPDPAGVRDEMKRERSEEDRP